MVATAAAVEPALARAFEAARGEDRPPGPAYLDFPTDLLRSAADPAANASEQEAQPTAGLAPEPASIARAARSLEGARRLLVISGRGAIGASVSLARYLERSGAVHLETAESRGAVPDDHPAQAPAVRARAMAEADLVLTLGRRLDFQLAYGSPAIFRSARAFLRGGRSDDELHGNREPEVALRGDLVQILEGLLAAGAHPQDPDLVWRDELHRASQEREQRLLSELQNPPPTTDGAIHPYALLAAVREVLDPETTLVADGGDILSFARLALRSRRWLDPGPLGCLGVGVPFAVAAALTRPGTRVLAVIGDGAFGLSAMEVETAVRCGARAVFIVADNRGWNIERHDQEARYGGNLVGVELGGHYDELARALGAHGERVEEAADLRPALARALASAPALVAVRVSRSPLSPDSRSGLAWVPDRQALASWDTAEADWSGGPA